MGSNSFLDKQSDMYQPQVDNVSFELWNVNHMTERSECGCVNGYKDTFTGYNKLQHIAAYVLIEAYQLKHNEKY